MSLCILKLHNVSSMFPCDYFIHNNLILRQTRLHSGYMHRALSSHPLFGVHFRLNNNCREDSSLQQHKWLIESALHDCLFYYVLKFLLFWEVYSGAKRILVAFMLLLFVNLVLLGKKDYVLNTLVLFFLSFVVDALYYFYD